jgi:type IV pilus assembly protein PilA
MVVVAIIGLLSAVAIPNFQKYQARTKQAEAKLHLSAMYTAEASFYATYNMYSTCLRYMGYDPTEETSSRYYMTGFYGGGTIDAAMYSSALNSGLTPTECPQSSSILSFGNDVFANGKFAATPTGGICIMYSGTTLGNQANDTTQTFTAGACGVIHKKFRNAMTSASALTINEKKVIQIRRNGF